MLRVRYYLPEGRNEQSGELHFGTGGASTTLQADTFRMGESAHSARSGQRFPRLDFPKADIQRDAQAYTASHVACSGY